MRMCIQLLYKESDYIYLEMIEDICVAYIMLMSIVQVYTKIHSLFSFQIHSEATQKNARDNINKLITL